MFRLVLALCACVWLFGCTQSQPPGPAQPAVAARRALPADFKGRQKYLFTEMDANAVYAGCQQLLRAKRAGKLSAGSYFCDDPPAKLKELPEALRKIRPTTVLLMTDTVVTLSFLSEDGDQSLMCTSNEFGEPSPGPAGPRGMGFRRGAGGMDKLTGKETLDDLNTTYDAIQLQLRPGLTYVSSRMGPRLTLEQEKQQAQGMETMGSFMEKTIAELAVKQQRLLYKTDHQELLKACRDALKDFNAGRFRTAEIHSLDPSGDPRQAEDFKRLPELIRKLEPVYVAFDPNRVIVALIGGLGHAGARAYAEGQAPAAANDAIKLIDGLWYYDDGLREGGPDYREYLKSLEKEVTTPLEWRRKHAAPKPPAPGR